MFNAANETHFSLTIEGIDHDLQVLAFNGREAISQPYRFDLELVSERADLDLKDLLHRPAFLALSPAGDGIHGLVHRVPDLVQSDLGDDVERVLLCHERMLTQESSAGQIRSKTDQNPFEIGRAHV